MTPPSNFDRVARLYRWAEYMALGPLLQQTRIHFLPQVAHTRRAVVLGDGDGRFLARLLVQNPELHAVALDSSAAMLALLRSRCERASSTAPYRLRTLQHSVLEHICSRDTDLIVSHFFLDCFTQPEVDAIAHHFGHTARPGTLWLLSDFRIPEGVLQPFAKVYVRALYFAFRILTGLRVTHLPNHGAALNAVGFGCIARHEKLGGLLYTELWQRQPQGIRAGAELI